MVRINLLPWREYKRVYQEKATKKMFFMAMAVSVLIIMFMHHVLANNVRDLHMRIKQLKLDIQRLTVVQKQLQEDESHQDIAQFIKKLIGYRAVSNQLFIELSHLEPAEVCFTEISRAKNKIIFTGYTHSAFDLTMFLKQWPALSLFTEVKLDYLKQQSAERLMAFRFQAVELHSFFTNVFAEDK